jgi:coproporphyrinogen III oxidase-like Fe-S oxidoreductase
MRSDSPDADAKADFSAIAGTATGSSAFRDAVSSAIGALKEMDICSRVSALKRRRANLKGKPYLHPLAKDKLRALSYDEVIDTIRPFPALIGSLYLHFPFCTKHCTHCHYFKTRQGHDTDWQEYPRYLIQELHLLLSAFGAKRIGAETIHVGGGTPSLIGADSWTNMMEVLGASVDLRQAIEIAIEVDPADLTAERLAFWLATGVNRISLGVQSFDDATLAALARQHDGRSAIDAVELIKSAGPRNLNIDLMYGMPGRDLESWYNDLQVVTALNPASITCYATRPDPTGDIDHAKSFPSENERLVAHEMAIQKLMGAGYFQFSPNQFIRDYGGACWAKNNRNRCHNILGIGPHAHSIFEGWFYENWVGVESYRTNIQSGKLNPLRGSRIEGAEARHRFLEFSVKLSGLNKPLLDNGISRRGYSDMFGSELDDDYEETLRELKTLGLIDCSHPLTLHLTHQGILLSNEIVRQFALQRGADDRLNQRPVLSG